MRFLVPLAALLSALSVPAVAQASAEPITIGEELTVRSAVLGVERKLAVYLPEGYAEGSESYPVLYLIDGGLQQDFLHVAGTTQLNSLWGRSRPVIVVGIETGDRRRELIGPTGGAEYLAEFPTAGHSAEFRRYIAEEVIPLVERRYRTSGESGVIGESLAGLFIVETALVAPGMFDRYAALSPSLWWDDGALSHRADALLGAQVGVPPIYLSMADEGPETEAPYSALVAAFAKRAAPGEAWCSVPRPDLTHATIYHSLSPQALQFLFPRDDAPEFAGFEPPCS